MRKEQCKGGQLKHEGSTAKHMLSRLIQITGGPLGWCELIVEIFVSGK